MAKKTQTANRAKISVLIAALLMFASLSMAYAGAGIASGAGQALGAENVPGVSGNALQYNKTETTPVCQMEQVMAGEPALFCYRNMTMLMNCTRNCELNVTVDPTVKPKILALSVEPNQTMKLTLNISGSPLEGARVMERTLNFYLGIEPNATLQLSAQIRLHINQTALSQELNREVNASRLTWMYWNRTQAAWETVPSYMDQNGYLVCNTNHFSTWTVAEIADAETPTESEPTQNALPMEYIFAVVVVVVIVVLAVGLIVFKRRKH
ncbi:hypothetical protein G4O51_07185 [Candidatus Bathyarchaeota archaeon A05DMB-2]|jgi:hypothetical protein|nr:hypothetical protein [Candidatus Bathyarchaeota archaeon A05DMB-2]